MTDPAAAKPPINLRALLLVLAIAVGTGIVFTPLLYSIGRASLRVEQLTNGAILVLLAILISLRGTLEKLRPQPKISRGGLMLLAWGIIGIGLTGLAKQWALPVALLAFCCCVGAVIAFLFGRVGVSHFLPAIGALFVFGLLVGLVPTLDWPLRAIAAKQAGNLLAVLGVPHELVGTAGRPPELVLLVGDQGYRVATECNGFGLLTSSLVVATMLAFKQPYPWLSKVGLIALAVPVAIVFNFLRIVGIALSYRRVPMSYNVLHETVGTIFYLAGLCLIWWIARRSTPERAPRNDPA